MTALLGKWKRDFRGEQTPLLVADGSIATGYPMRYRRTGLG